MKTLWRYVLAVSFLVLLSTNYVSAGVVSALVDIGISDGKTNANKTGSLTSTATTAGQTVLTYTVSAGKTYYLLAQEIEVRLTTLSATASVLGACSWTIGGVVQNTFNFTNRTVEEVDRMMLPFNSPMPVAAGTVISAICTPAAATSMLWQANLVGYEK